MAQLVLIRHGQAHAFSTDSDRLTELGERQARILGEHFVAQGVVFDAVFSGSLLRHAQTEAQVAAAYERAGRPFPKREVVPGWNEYDAHSVMQKLVPALAARDRDFERLFGEFLAKATDPDRNRYFQRMFERLIAAWVDREVDVPGVEPFDEFHERVVDSLQSLLSGSVRGRIAVFTSGGPIGVCVQTALKAPKASALDVNWRVRNTSLTELLFGRGRVSLDLFNATAHLPEDLVTYR